MKFLNLFLFIVLAVLFVMEGKRILTNYKSCKAAMEDVMTTKKDIKVVKDYKKTVIIYAIIVVLIVIAGVYNIVIKDYFTALMILGLAFFWGNLIVESIYTKTYVFFESGFLYTDKQYKYRSVLKIEDEKQFARGYKVNVIGGDDVYVTKNVRPILEQKLKEYKNRKKK